MSDSFKIPFIHYPEDDAAEMCEWANLEGEDIDQSRRDSVTEWRDNVAFDATIRVSGLDLGRWSSLMRIYAYNTANRELYSMGISAFYEAVTLFGVSNGEITGRWSFLKQEHNYTLWPKRENVT